MQNLDTRMSRNDASDVASSVEMTGVSMLRSHGLRITHQRKVVIGVLANNRDRHLSVEDVYREATKTGARLGINSCYRTVRELEQIGFLVRRVILQGRAVYSLNDGGCHHHVVCVACRTMAEFSDSNLDGHVATIVQSFGLKPIGTSLVLHGVCQTCEAQAHSPARTMSSMDSEAS